MTDNVSNGAPFSEPRFGSVDLTLANTTYQVFRSPHPDSGATSMSYIRQIVFTNSNTTTAAKFILWDEDTTASGTVTTEKRGSSSTPLLTIMVVPQSSFVLEPANLGFYIQQGVAAQSSLASASMAVFADTRL